MWTRILPILSLFGLASTCLAQDSGTLAGSVRFLGEVPPAQKVMTTDGGTILHRDLVVDAKSKGLRYVVVLLENVRPQPRVEKSPPVVVDQRDMLFVPRVVAVREGQVVRFENNDLCNHAVNAMSTNPANVFNVLTPQNNPHETKFTTQKAPVVIGCPIHPWMRAWVYVLPHPYYAVTDVSGRFRIEGIPVGKHSLLFTHPDTGKQQRRDIEITAGKMTLVDVEW